jgi:hypothetical protein
MRLRLYGILCTLSGRPRVVATLVRCLKNIGKSWRNILDARHGLLQRSQEDEQNERHDQRAGA